MSILVKLEDNITSFKSYFPIKFPLNSQNEQFMNSLLQVCLDMGFISLTKLTSQMRRFEWNINKLDILNSFFSFSSDNFITEIEDIKRTLDFTKYGSSADIIENLVRLTESLIEEIKKKLVIGLFLSNFFGLTYKKGNIILPTLNGSKYSQLNVLDKKSLLIHQLCKYQSKNPENVSGTHAIPFLIILHTLQKHQTLSFSEFNSLLLAKTENEAEADVLIEFLRKDVDEKKIYELLSNEELNITCMNILETFEYLNIINKTHEISLSHTFTEIFPVQMDSNLASHWRQRKIWRRYYNNPEWRLSPVTLEIKITNSKNNPLSNVILEILSPIFRERFFVGVTDKRGKISAEIPRETFLTRIFDKQDLIFQRKIEFSKLNKVSSIQILERDRISSTDEVEMMVNYLNQLANQRNLFNFDDVLREIVVRAKEIGRYNEIITKHSENQIWKARMGQILSELLVKIKRISNVKWNGFIDSSGVPIINNDVIDIEYIDASKRVYIYISSNKAIRKQWEEDAKFLNDFLRSSSNEERLLDSTEIPRSMVMIGVQIYHRCRDYFANLPFNVELYTLNSFISFLLDKIAN